jgi:tryptophan 2,3-dioxygenase
MLFIIQHQTTELWFKLVIHELRRRSGTSGRTSLSRASRSSRGSSTSRPSSSTSGAVLATLTPSEYAAVPRRARSASGFQSVQYRLVEFLLGNKDARMVERARAGPRGACGAREA